MGYIGYNQFKPESAALGDTYWINLSLNLKYRGTMPNLPHSPWRYFINAGPGYYIPNNGTNGAGANIGAGISYDVKSFLSIELGADFHTVFEQDVYFWQSHAGLIFKF